MKSTTELHNDHEEIKGVLAAMRGFVSRGEVFPAVLRETVTFSQMYVDRCHHGKEESCLFPCLQGRGVPREQGPIAVLLMEHDIGRRLVRGILETVEKFEAGTATKEEVLNAVRDYADLLEGHIWKEENVLFPMAADIMNEEDDAQTMRCYGKVGQENVPAGTVEKMRDLGRKIAASRGTS